MLRTVKLDHETRGETGEVGDVRPDRTWRRKCALKVSSLRLAPQGGFRARLIAAGALSRRNFIIGFREVGTVHPTPVPALPADPPLQEGGRASGFSYESLEIHLQACRGCRMRRSTVETISRSSTNTSLKPDRRRASTAPAGAGGTKRTRSSFGCTALEMSKARSPLLKKAPMHHPVALPGGTAAAHSLDVVGAEAGRALHRACSRPLSGQVEIGIEVGLAVAGVGGSRSSFGQSVALFGGRLVGHQLPARDRTAARIGAGEASVGSGELVQDREIGAWFRLVGDGSRATNMPASMIGEVSSRSGRSVIDVLRKLCARL